MAPFYHLYRKKFLARRFYMLPLRVFIDTMADYMGNASRLPFLSPAFEVTAPHDNNCHIHVFTFQVKAFGCFAYFGVMHQSGSQLYISTLNSHVGVPRPARRPLGFGREILRRAVLFADEHGYDAVRTSNFSAGAASFWLGMGFNSEPNITPDWSHIAAQDADLWQKRLDAAPNDIWDLARTEIGRRALEKAECNGYLSLHCQNQRRYTFRRLGLVP
jgi:hypothetical protein